MIRVYIAAPYGCKPDALVAQRQFEAAGFEVSSRWITTQEDVEYSDLADPAHMEMFAQHAIDDVRDVQASDVFVILNLALSEGKATEFGIAYMLGIPVIVVGACSRNLFYRLPGVYQADSVDEAIGAILASVNPVTPASAS